ncbi:PCMD domain-containing protein [Pedobacter nyackensis]|uniref:PCMD domain-containing protein n=1 Tax=Pedobacter nyackensis TaxID=475255 RepID=UPI00292CEF84|nr:PCMD domain-containing protein [Pedobacter nyackensis]
MSLHVYRPISFLIIAVGIFLSGCVKETYFGKSTYKKVLYFTMPGQSATTVIDHDQLTIKLLVDAASDLTKLYPDSIRLSTFAHITPGVNIPQDFTNPVNYTVTAEDGSIAVYKVEVTRQSATPQITNSNFDSWYTPPGKNYKQPGMDMNTDWATGNAGVVTLGAANTTPVEVSSGDFAAQMVTRDLGVLGQVTGQRMGAATLFTGTFTLDISNPLNSPKFGIAFTARPKSFSVDFKYSPGTPYKNGRGQELVKKDSCDIYLLLENRNNNVNKRIATAWFRSGDSASTFTRITIPLLYGNLPAETPGYQFPENGLFALAGEPVTHLTIVFASSAYANLFEGGVNSILVVNNLSLNY